MSLNNMLRYETQNTRVFSPTIISQGPRKHSVQRQLWQPVELQTRVWRRKRLAHSSGENWDLPIWVPFGQQTFSILPFGQRTISILPLLVNRLSQSSHLPDCQLSDNPWGHQGSLPVVLRPGILQILWTVISSPTNGIFGKLWIRTSCFVILFGKTCWVTNGL